MKPEGRPGAYLLRDPGHLLALGFGAGLMPRAPGTFGTLAALPLYWVLASTLALPAYLGVVAVLAGLGVFLCGRTARVLGAQDPGAVVWDEIVGLLLALAGVPPDWPWVLAGLVLFRGLDILKPWPVSWVERRFHGGLGIMADDLVAGALVLALTGLGRGLFQ
ncbi:MAG: phosphatidylglycerophosphatase A [Gammaproteobacteria bacterium]|nr:MAG: phosphatidylglycerophosphatase A [Gammaproteobacteria bacterium]